MRYLMMICSDEKQIAAVSEAEGSAYWPSTASSWKR